MRNKLKIAVILSIYLFGTLQFVIPYLEYFVNYDFIVENLCEQKDELENMCMGSCYLNDKLVQKIKEMQNKPAEQKQEEFNNLLLLSFHYTELEVELDEYTSNRKYFHQYNLHPTTFLTEPVLPPPRIS